MPYIIRKVRNKNCYEVKNKNTGKINAKCSTKNKAKKQVKMLEMIDNKKNNK